MQRINSKKGVVFIINDDGSYTLEKGSRVSLAVRKSASPSILTLRSTKVNPSTGETTEDLRFSSLSAMASFIQGAQTNGNAFFKNDLNGETATASTPTKATAAKAEEPTAQPIDVDENGYAKLTSQIAKQADEVAKRIMTFCKDFVFKPDPRLLNTMRHCSSKDEATELLINSMELDGFPTEDIEEARNKTRSPEWGDIYKSLMACPLTHAKVNQRLAIYYGPAGTGKTTKAIEDNPDATRIVASPTQDPSELFTRNVVNDHGGVDVVLTEIGKAMTDGKPIIIDELNLYQMCVLTRLQGITDGGKKLTDNGVEIEIADGFKIIATMNLETNMGKTPLPDPLVSRAGEIVKMDNPKLGWVF